MTGCNIQIQPTSGIYAVDVTGIIGVTAIRTSQKPLGPFNSWIPPCQPLLMLIPASQQRQQVSQHPHSWSVTGTCPRASPPPVGKVTVWWRIQWPSHVMWSCRGPAIWNRLLEKYILNALAGQMLSCSNLLCAALDAETYWAFNSSEKESI